MGFVYFFQARRGRVLSIKIGRTHQCPERRLRQEMKKWPEFDSLRLVAVIETADPIRDERRYQKQFAHLQRPQKDSFWLRSRHELSMFSGKEQDWFSSDPELIEFIREMATPHVCDPGCHKRTSSDVLRKQEVDAFKKKLSEKFSSKLREQVRTFETKLRADQTEQRKARSSPKRKPLST